MQLKLDSSVYQRRLNRIRENLKARQMDALYLTSPISMFYVSGCWLVQTERPIALVIPVDREPFLMIPGLETDHVQVVAPFIGDIEAYFDYPGHEHPMVLFGRWMSARGLSKARIGFDASATGIMGYRGPAISEVLPSATFVPARDLVANLRLRKGPEEIAFFRESARWGMRAQEVLQSIVRVGDLEIVTGMEISRLVTNEMLEELGSDYAWILGYGYGPVFAIFRTGAITAFPHPLSFARRIEKDAVCITGCGAKVGGYNAELERTIFIGTPNRDHLYCFDKMVRIQEYALSCFAPGRRCSDVEADIRSFIEEQGCSEFVRHHTGHAIGLEVHEPPFIDVGDQTVMEPGMLFSCEPGLYVPGLGGFRHSDTVLITETGTEVLTKSCPKDLESVIIPV